MIYFIQEAGKPDAPIKIGYTSGNAEGRLASLQTGYPAKLAVIASCDGGQSHESSVHARFGHLRLHGEWFRPDDDLLGYIARVTVGSAKPSPANGERTRAARREDESTKWLHVWVHSSGTTRICRGCGCIKYCCGCCTGGEDRYSLWSRKESDWMDDVWKATPEPPVCDSSRPVPDWVRSKEG